MADGTQATQRGTKSTLPATKGFIRAVRELPKLTKVWIQGLVVWVYQGGIAVDDGTGIARVAFLNYEKLDSASPVEHLSNGMYVMVIGDVRKKLVGHRLGIRALTVRDLTPQGSLMESLWALEVADVCLTEHEMPEEEDNIVL